ncbi:MAG: helix-turn-helix transcriptional regulator [Erysipelotrichaceae bacterium]|nr:helix-turn-helix transcriptional regulator [Erysipelotrichaceae bacterium]MBR2791091.1 helix-turn-helix transcriptional regulator [Erysipelotrichaceae bacterium]MBR3352113.1 helix-turn-helix transcriptional regulator [Erysipelotrichaceae bacterium]MBR6957726.1 helix-turn-helix transcriptional regulator [Erysipelotrichaceae bacterium]
MDVGQRIRQLRMLNGLTQEELASRCELTKGFLSQLENNLATPSLPTLMDIVEALGTDMSTFFKETDETQICFSRDDFFVDEREGYTINWIVPNAQKNTMEPIIVEIAPGSCSQVMQPHEGEEFCYVLNGKVTLVMGDREYEVRKGNTFYINGEREHYLRNDSAHAAQVLWICSPPLF